MYKNYLLAVINILAATLMAAGFGVLLIFQIKVYELNVSYSFSWRFFLYDPFVSRLIFLMLIGMVANLIAAVVLVSGLYASVTESNWAITAICSILWIMVYLISDYMFEQWAIFPVVLLLLTLIILMTMQTSTNRIKIGLLFTTALVLIVPIIGRLSDENATENIPERELIEFN